MGFLILTVEGDIIEFAHKSGLKGLFEVEIFTGNFLSECALPLEILFSLGEHFPPSEEVIVILLYLLYFLVIAVSSNPV